MNFPIGTTEEVKKFEKKNKDHIQSWTSESNFFLGEKTISYRLWDGSLVEFTFPVSEMTIT